MAEFVRGQLWVMGVLATYYAIGLSLAGLQFALLAVEFVFRFQRLVEGERTRRVEATSVS